MATPTEREIKRYRDLLNVARVDSGAADSERAQALRYLQALELKFPELRYYGDAPPPVEPASAKAEEDDFWSNMTAFLNQVGSAAGSAFASGRKVAESVKRANTVNNGTEIKITQPASGLATAAIRVSPDAVNALLDMSRSERKAILTALCAALHSDMEEFFSP